MTSPRVIINFYISPIYDKIVIVKKIVINSLIIFLAIFISSASSLGHASALSIGAMEDMGHGNSSMACLNICMVGTVEKEDFKTLKIGGVEGKSPVAHYTQLASQAYPIESLTKTSLDNAFTLKRPPKIPPFILFLVMRN